MHLVKMDWDGSIVHDNCDWFDNIEPLKTEIIMVTSGLATMTKNCMKKYKEKTDESDVNVNVLFVRLFLGGWELTRGRPEKVWL